jgi:hypothetical protein
MGVRNAHITLTADAIASVATCDRCGKQALARHDGPKDATPPDEQERELAALHARGYRPEGTDRGWLHVTPAPVSFAEQALSFCIDCRTPALSVLREWAAQAPAQVGG